MSYEAPISNGMSCIEYVDVVDERGKKAEDQERKRNQAGI